MRAAAPQALFDASVPTGTAADALTLAESRDGSRILVLRAVQQPNPQLTYVMTAWDTVLPR